MTLVTIKLANQAAPTFQATTDSEARQFSGVAHSGKPFTQYGTRYIVDLTNIQFRTQTGVLLEHSPERKVGVGTLSVGAAGLYIDGKLLSTDDGKHVATTADEGFPWELSAYIQSARQEQLAQGETVVNGQAIAAPCVILRDCSVREVSFVAVGADAHTSAVVLSDGSDFIPNFSLSHQSAQENSTMTKEEQAAFDALQAELETLKTEKAQLEQEKAAAEKKTKVDKKLSVAGFTMDADGKFANVSETTYALLLSANDDALDSVIGDLKLGLNQHKPKLPDHLMHDTPTSQNGVQLSAMQPENVQPRTLGGYSMI